jgi:hypothetical protein
LETTALETEAAPAAVFTAVLVDACKPAETAAAIEAVTLDVAAEAAD